MPGTDRAKLFLASPSPLVELKYLGYYQTTHFDVRMVDEGGRTEREGVGLVRACVRACFWPAGGKGFKRV